jgi:putative heme-binding domain-containing protein
MYRFALCALLAACAAAQEEHGYTAAEIERGEQAYMANCSSCHGASGDGIPGVNLATGRYRRATTDDELIAIVSNGIPGTAMPPGNYPPTQARVMVGYLRSMASGTRAARGSGLEGNSGRGKSLFEGKGECLNCHREKGKGGFLGPDLSEIGKARSAAALERSLLEPGAEVRTDNRTVRAVSKDNSRVLGRLLNQDTYTIQLIDGKGSLRSLRKDALSEFEVMKGSAMPVYQGKLNAQEIADVVAYLTTLK